MNQETMNNFNFNEMCPECGGKMHDHTDLYIDECDRCLAKKSE